MPNKKQEIVIIRDYNMLKDTQDLLTLLKNGHKAVSVESASGDSNGEWVNAVKIILTAKETKRQK